MYRTRKSHKKSGRKLSYYGYMDFSKHIQIVIYPREPQWSKAAVSIVEVNYMHSVAFHKTFFSFLFQKVIYI